MYSELDQYLEKVGKKISNKEARFHICLELKNHFLEKIDYLIDQGISEEDALRQTLDEATSPFELGRKLNVAYRPYWQRKLLLFSLIFFLLFGCVLVIYTSHYLVEKMITYSPVQDLAKHEYFLSEFEKDLKIIKRKDLSTSRHKNAHFYIKKSLPAYWSNYSKNESTGFYKEEMKRYRGWRTNSLAMKRALENINFKELRLEWVDEILSYDHINFYPDDEVQDHLKIEKEDDIFKKLERSSSLLTPNFSEFDKIVKIRVLEHIKNNNVLVAKKILLKLFSLMRSTHSIIGRGIAASDLRYFNLLVDTFGLSWEKFDEQYIKAERRSAWGWSQIFYTMDFESRDFQNFLKISGKSQDHCVGFVENALGFSLFNGLFKDPFIFEVNLEEKGQRFLSFAGNNLKKCGLGSLAKFIESDVSKTRLFDDRIFKEMGKNTFGLNLFAIPYIRGIYIAYEIQSTTPQYNGIYFRSYKDSKPIPK